MRAIDEGRFDNEIVAVGDCAMDEGPGGGGSIEKMQQLPTLIEEVASPQPSPARSQTRPLLIASEQAIKEHDLRPEPASTT